ncbi:MAG: zinc-ribbon domain-containing protein [Candidatus Bathyarchaeota archaeon]|nr:zinc-ribbon domain-containing protein [Candidatus Bathyarchaeota archaeon]
MRKITTRYITGYALGFALCLAGLTVLVAILWSAWPNVSISNGVFPALEQYLWTKEFDIGLGVKLKLMHYTITGTAVLVLGIFVLVFSRKVLYVEENVLLQCPFCKNQWKASRAKGWGKCPYCNHTVHPTAVENRK